MSQSRAVRISKLLSLALRHDPSTLGIELDEAGWVEVEAVLAGLARKGRAISREVLEELVRSSDKQRFAFSEDGTRIRANQGHSVEVDLGYVASEPPAKLFHGTVAKAVDAIRSDGLKRMKRHHVHLSVDVETATKVGARRGTPIILVIDAAAMVAAGHVFYRSTNGVWLVDEVPPRFIEFPVR